MMEIDATTVQTMVVAARATHIGFTKSWKTSVNEVSKKTRVKMPRREPGAITIRATLKIAKIVRPFAANMAESTTELILQ